MITAYGGVNLKRHTSKRCRLVLNIILIRAIADLITGYVGEVEVFDIDILPSLYRRSIYNVPVCNEDWQGPTRTIRELSPGTVNALALNGFNHTRQGMIDICAWMDGTSMCRPAGILVFQAGFVGHVQQHRVGVPYISEHVPGWDFDCRRQWHLSAWDALCMLSNHTEAACNNRNGTHPYDGTQGSQSKHLDVLFVHLLSREVEVHTNLIVTRRKYARNQSKVWTDQKLVHTIVAEYPVYIGGIASNECPAGSSSGIDYMLLRVVQTDVYRG
jgi:hypothetical protein